LGKLANAVMPIAGEQIAFVASPQTALKMRLAVGPQFTYAILSSGHIAAGTVIAVGLNALASAVDPQIRIDVTEEAILHFDDTAPLNIMSGTMIAPVRSMFQTDSLAVRLILRVNWALRDAAGAAFISSVTW
jgi:hypothetical protein